MENNLIFRSLGLSVDPETYVFGPPQQSGPMTVLPVLARGGKPASAGKFAPPLSGLKLGGVKRGYGNVELHHSLPDGVAVVPLHMGYIQDGAQNHALCRSAFIAPAQQVVFEDACCVQQAQGGFLQDREQWFFILPLALREEALDLRGKKGFGKLWPAIATLSVRFGMENRGHLEQVLCRRRPFLTQYQSRFELLDGQTGALFFLRDRLVGVELAPDAGYFSELWMPLVCFCYGTAAMELEQRADVARVAAAGRRKAGDGSGKDIAWASVASASSTAPKQFKAGNLAELRQQLADSRWDRQLRLRDRISREPPERLHKQEEERYLGLRLFTAVGQKLAGQIVEDEGRLVYASLAARAAYLRRLN